MSDAETKGNALETSITSPRRLFSVRLGLSPLLHLKEARVPPYEMGVLSRLDKKTRKEAV